MYRVLVLDLDGTLLRSDKTISRKTVEVLKKCDKLGLQIIIATARPHRFVKKILPKFLNSKYKVVFNGAEIYHGDKLIYSNYLNQSEIANAIEVSKKHLVNKRLGIESNGVLYANYNIASLFSPVVFTRVETDGLIKKEAAKVLLDLRGEPDYKLIEDCLVESCKMIVTDQSCLGQITKKNVSKLTAIEYILTKTKYSLNNVIAFGDDFNDLELIRDSGLGVAMANAESSIKQIADFITMNNNSDGVAMFLENKLYQCI